MSERDWDGWRGLLRGKRTDHAEVRALRLDTAPAGGGSGAFRVRGDDGRRYWVKPLNNRQGQRVTVTEQIVGRTGRLIGAPVCDVRTIEIPRDLAGLDTGRGMRVEAGIAHGSREVAAATETRRLAHPERDENRSRYVGYAVLYEWCWGGDQQGLHCGEEDMSFYSHDHGWFLPPTGPDWTIEELEKHVECEHPCPTWPIVTSPEFVEPYAGYLETLGRNALADVLATVPASWPVSDEELECVGWFLERRARMLAVRLREQAGRKA